MKTFRELKKGDYVYCIFLDDKTVEIAQIIDMSLYNTIDNDIVMFICNKVLSSSFYTISVFCLTNIEMDRYEKVERDIYITSDENVFTEYLKQITNENF